MTCSEYRKEMRRTFARRRIPDPDLATHLQECEGCCDFWDMVEASGMSRGRACPDPIDLLDYVCGLLDGTELIRVAAHAVVCTTCARNLADAIRARASIRGP